LTDVDVVGQVLAEVRALRLMIEGRGLPQVLTMKRAAVELSVSLSQLGVLIRSGSLLTVTIGKRRMVPASEVRRLATPETATCRNGHKYTASTLLQDPDALRR